jgi:hypothetical protein
LQGCIFSHYIGTDVDCSFPCVDDQRLVSVLLDASGEMIQMVTTTNLQVLTCLSVGSTEVEIRFSFGHEMDSGTSFWGVRDDIRLDCSSPELTMLCITPLVRMGQHELDATRHEIPAVFSNWIGLDKEIFGGIEEIAHEIREDVDNRFSHWEFRDHVAP